MSKVSLHIVVRVYSQSEPRCKVLSTYYCTGVSYTTISTQRFRNMGPNCCNGRWDIWQIDLKKKNHDRLKLIASAGFVRTIPFKSLMCACVQGGSVSIVFSLVRNVLRGVGFFTKNETWQGRVKEEYKYGRGIREMFVQLFYPPSGSQMEQPLNYNKTKYMYRVPFYVFQPFRL